MPITMDEVRTVEKAMAIIDEFIENAPIETEAVITVNEYLENLAAISGRLLGLLIEVRKVDGGTT